MAHFKPPFCSAWFWKEASFRTTQQSTNKTTDNVYYNLQQEISLYDYQFEAVLLASGLFYLEPTIVYWSSKTTKK